MEENENRSVETAGEENKETGAESEVIRAQTLTEVTQAQTRAADSGEIQDMEATQPSREEILATSRRENKRGDEREAQENLKGMGLAYSVGILIMGIVYLVNVLIEKEPPLELMMAYMGMTATWSIWYAVKSNKHRGLFVACGVLSTVTFIFFTVFWILKLCGVVID